MRLRGWLVLLVALFGAAWYQAARHVCHGWSCYRLGNYLDLWLQRELWRSYGGDAAIPDQLASVLGTYAVGAGARRILRLEGMHSTLLEHAYMHRARSVDLPLQSFWNTSEGTALLTTLRHAASRHWPRGVDVLWHHNWLRYGATLRHLATSVRGLIDSFALREHRPLPLGREAPGPTCVVHVRVGDFVQIKGVRALEAELDRLVWTAAGLRPPPARMVILQGGASHGCSSQQAAQQCGQQYLSRLQARLRAAVPNASVLMSYEQRGRHAWAANGADGDFLMLADADVALGSVGSSFSWFGSLRADIGAAERRVGTRQARVVGRDVLGGGGARSHVLA